GPKTLRRSRKEGAGVARFRRFRFGWVMEPKNSLAWSNEDARTVRSGRSGRAVEKRLHGTVEEGAQAARRGCSRISIEPQGLKTLRRGRKRVREPQGSRSLNRLVREVLMDFAAQSKKRAQESQDYCAPHFCTPFPVALYLRVLIRRELAAVYVTYWYSFCFPAPVPGHGRAGIGKMLWDRRQNLACPAYVSLNHRLLVPST